MPCWYENWKGELEKKLLFLLGYFLIKLAKTLSINTAQSLPGRSCQGSIGWSSSRSCAPMRWWQLLGSLWRNTWATTLYPPVLLIWRRFMMTPPLKLLSYSSYHQVCMCHGLNLWVNFSKIKNNILYFQNPLVILFLYIVYCCNSSTSKIKNSTLFHYRYRPPGTVSEVCGGAEGQCLAPGYDLPGARSRPQGRGADLKGPDSKGTLGVLTELSSGSLLHASATGHSRKVRVTNIMC